jgi:hypothetical protein
LIGLALYLVGIVLWIVLMIKAFQHETFRVPVAADIADGFVKQTHSHLFTRADGNSRSRGAALPARRIARSTARR